MTKKEKLHRRGPERSSGIMRTSLNYKKKLQSQFLVYVMRRRKLENLTVPEKFKGKEGGEERERKKEISTDLDGMGKEKSLNRSETPMKTQDGDARSSVLSGRNKNYPGFFFFVFV